MFRKTISWFSEEIYLHKTIVRDGKRLASK